MEPGRRLMCTVDTVVSTFTMCMIPGVAEALRGVGRVLRPGGEGICGAAVAQGETVIVEDVSADPRYLACSLETRSEIVVPIRTNGKIVGEIDIDSHTRSAFGSEDRSFLEECAAVLGEFLEKERHFPVS